MKAIISLYSILTQSLSFKHLPFLIFPRVIIMHNKGNVHFSSGQSVTNIECLNIYPKNTKNSKYNMNQSYHWG